jgi:carboxylesterase
MKNRPPIYQHPELDGTDLFVKGENYQDIALLFIHGFTATTVEVRQLANYFNKKGFTVRAPLLPGHGTTPKDLNRKNWKDWTQAVEDTYTLLHGNHAYIYVFGESMGALLTLWLADKHDEISKIFLFSPALIINGLRKSKYLWPLKEYIYKKNTDDSMLWQGYNVVPLRAAASLYDFQQNVKKLLPTITAEVAIFQGMLDKTIDINSAQIVYDGLISSRRKTLTWLQKSHHVILLDEQIGEVQDQCLNAILAE